MKSSQLISLALSQLDCNQKELAKTLGVSQTQITKWKKDEHMSWEMENSVKSLLGLSEMVSSELLEFAGSPKKAERWVSMLAMVQNDAAEDREVPYTSGSMEDNHEFFTNTVPAIIRSLKQAGYPLTPTLPDELLPDSIPEDSCQLEDDGELFRTHPEIEVLRGIFGAIYDLEAFYSAYMCDIEFAYEEEEGSGEMRVESYIPEYAVFKYIEEKLGKADEQEKETLETMFPTFLDLRKDIRSHMIDATYELKQFAVRKNIPLEAELMDFITEYHNPLGGDSESKAFGFTKARVHPDIYMNEIIESQRMLHTVLPLILKKLDIDMKQLKDTKLLLDI